MFYIYIWLDAETLQGYFFAFLSFALVFILYDF